MTAVLAALRRVLGAPGWVAAVWVASVAIAAGAGAIVHAAVAGAIGMFGPAPDGRLAYGLTDLALDHEAIPSTATATIVMSALLGVVAWSLFAGAVVARLDTPRRDVATTWARTLPAVVVQSLWHLAIRAIVVFAALSTASALPPAAGWPLLWLGWSIGTVGLDLARVRAVRGLDSPYHPRTAGLALLDVVRNPGRFAAAVGLAALGAIVPLVVVYASLAMLGSPVMPTVARALSLGACIVGLWRIALVTDADPPSTAA